MPRSLMTRSLPRPRMRCGMAALPREADERAQLERVVDGREQVGRAADPHRREPGQRLVPRRLDADPALDLRPDGDRVEGGRRRSREPPRGSGARRSPASGSGSRGRRRARGRRPHRPPRADRAPRAAADIAEVGRRVVEQRRRLEQRRRIEVVVVDESAGAGLDELAGVGRLVAGRVRIRDDDDRADPARSPRRASTTRRDRRRGRPRPGPSACRRAGTGAGGSDRVPRRGAPRDRPARPRSRRRRSRG